MNRAADAREVRDPVSPDQIRNVVLVGPTGAGKTALFDRILAATVPGRRPRESHEPSLALSVASVERNGVVVNVLPPNSIVVALLVIHNVPPFCTRKLFM